MASTTFLFFYYFKYGDKKLDWNFAENHEKMEIPKSNVL